MPHFHFYPALFRIDEGDQSRRKGGKAHMHSRETDANSDKHTRLDYHATVRELPSHERPRERLQHFGPQALSMAELLAIILRTGTRGDNLVDLANKLLSKYGGLPGRGGEPGDAEPGVPGHRADAHPAAGREGPAGREDQQLP